MRLGENGGSPRQIFWSLGTTLLCIVMGLAGRGSVAVAVGVAVAVPAGLIGFGATIRTHQEIHQSSLHAGFLYYSMNYTYRGRNIVATFY